ncbi:MAG: S46 family peptidase [Calditrichia bacterium]
MKKAKRVLFSAITGILLLLSISMADEGMWLPHQMPSLQLEKKGLQMDPAELYKSDGTGLMSAVVSLGGGTGEFVSQNGLILTNHHVAFGAIQRASSPEHNYLENGFIAWKHEEEIEAPGYIADVLLGYEDVTPEFEDVLNSELSPSERYKQIEKISKKLIADFEQKGEDLRAEVKSMYSGNQYYLFKFKRIKDIRIVYAPPMDLGNFGGEEDNWMWPRHTADFTFLRAYVSPDGKGVPYSKENVPYRPKSFLKISLDGVKEGDFTFVMGYPGRTYRNHTSVEFQYDLQRMKERLQLFQEIIDFFEEQSLKSEAVKIKYASLLKAFYNVKKNYTGKIEGFEKNHLISRKEKKEAEAKSKLRNPELLEYALKEMKSFYPEFINYQKKVQQLSELTNSYTGPAMLAAAHTIVRTVQERSKPDLEREMAYQERNLPRIKQGLQLLDRRMDLEVDRAYFALIIKKLQNKSAEELPASLQEIMGQMADTPIDEWAKAIYSRSKLSDPEQRLKYLDLSPEELSKTDDPLIQIALKIEKDLSAYREQEKAYYEELRSIRSRYEKALLIAFDGRLAPDANSTIRFTSGYVQGYSPRDAVVYLPLTTLTGVIEKDRGEAPFRVPQKIKELYEAKDFGRYVGENDMINTCFLNTTAVTGGNSGSPTLNARGEQVGIIFDMTYESVIGDYLIIPELQRTISVDIRYVLWITEKFAGAKHIIDELEIN